MAFWNRNKTPSSSQSINIDTALLREAASRISSSNQDMHNQAKSILTTVEGLEDDWDSSLQKDFRTRVKKTEEVYEYYYGLLDNVSRLFNQIATEYENVENKLNKAAQDK